jgi:hypothetical protein
MNEFKEKFTDGKEIKYAGKANDLSIFSGNNRLQLQFVLGPDPNVNKTIVFWNNKKDSVILTYDRADLLSDTINHIFENMPENSYSFDVINYDKFGNKSVLSTVTGKSYGKNYISTLYNRYIDKTEVVNEVNKDINIIWRDSLLNTVGVELQYVTNDDEEVDIFVANTDTETFLENCNTDHPVTYTTLYKPEPTSIDTFRADISSYQILLAYQLSSAAFSPLVLDNDAPKHGDWNIAWAYLWDGRWSKNPDGAWYEEVDYLNFTTELKKEGYEGPAWVTIDIGESFVLYKAVVNLYWPWQGSCPKVYEIWGYKGEGAPPQNGEWTEDWIKLGDKNNEVNRESYAGGDTLILDDSAPAIRYIRMKCIETYNNDNKIKNFSIGELRIWAYPNL